MKGSIEGKKSPLAILLLTLLLVSAFAGCMIKTVSAAGYTEHVGTLSGANNFVVRFPDQWNGMLVVVCRQSGAVLDPRTSFFNTTATYLLPQGFAVAASNYGQENTWASARNDTYQLTKYLIDTYHISGKIFLVGASYGGPVALFLAAEYPTTYSGVLEFDGIKDAKENYYYKALIGNMTLPEIRSYVLANCGASPTAVTDSALQYLKIFCNSSATGYFNGAGGTPQTNPNYYEDLSPTYHANITVPEITVHGTGDMICPFSESKLYQAAVASTGRSSMYRLYGVPPAGTVNFSTLDAGSASLGHVDANALAQLPTRFAELITWSNALDSQITGPLAASTFSSATVFVGQTWYFSVHANGGVSPYKFQWYEGNVAITGQTDMVVAAGKQTPGTYTYYCKVTDARGITADSTPVTLIVK